MLRDDAEAGGGLQVAVIQLAITGGAAIGGLLFDPIGWWSSFAFGAALLCGSSLAAWRGLAQLGALEMKPARHALHAPRRCSERDPGLRSVAASGIRPNRNDPARPGEHVHEDTDLVRRPRLTATLYDNPSARDFASMLPLDLTIEDYANNEKIAYLPRKLTEEGSGPFGNERRATSATSRPGAISPSSTPATASRAG